MKGSKDPERLNRALSAVSSVLDHYIKKEDAMMALIVWCKIGLRIDKTQEISDMVQMHPGIVRNKLSKFMQKVREHGDINNGRTKPNPSNVPAISKTRRSSTKH